MKFNSNDEISLCLTADICNAIFDEHNSKKRWDEIIYAAIRLEESLGNLKDDFNQTPKITWFVRADPKMKSQMGTATYLLKRYFAHFSRFRAKGHEIAWHPHLSYHNLQYELHKLPKIVEDVRNYFTVTSVRVGEGFHSNELMHLMELLDFSIDSTALPGRKNLNARTPFDWEGSPATPYFPNQSDYRRHDSSKLSGILEVPFTMLPIRLDGDKPGPTARYMNFSYYCELFRSGVMAKDNWNDVLVGITHPAEICHPEDNNKSHKLLGFDEMAPRKNIQFLMERLNSLGKKVRFSSIQNIREGNRDKLNVPDTILHKKRYQITTGGV
ncbi:hypothetical protein KKB99_05530 [bacterium]|nr:hypothetical protein [bacterium]MBU1025457.1 hypothetical protein [bacterium]